MKKGKISLYILSLLAIAAVIWLVFAFAPSAQIETAPVVLPTAAPAIDGDDSSNSHGSSSLLEIEVTPKNVQTVIASLSRADSYYRVLTSELFWENGSSVTHSQVWVRGESVRIIISSEHETEHVLITDGELYLWHEGSGDIYTAPAGENDADEYQRLVTYEDILNISPRLITDAGYVDYNGTRCIYAEYTDELLGYSHRVYVAVSTGLVMGDETYDGEVLIYNQSSSEPEIITPEDEVFEKPNL